MKQTKDTKIAKGTKLEEPDDPRGVGLVHSELFVRWGFRLTLAVLASTAIVSALEWFGTGPPLAW